MRGNLLCVASSGIWTRSLALTSTCGKTLHIISWLALFTSNSFGNLYHRVLGRWLTWSCGVSEHCLTKRPHTIISIFDQFPNFSVGVFDDQSLGPHFQIKANLLNKMNLKVWSRASHVPEWWHFWTLFMHQHTEVFCSESINFSFSDKLCPS